MTNPMPAPYPQVTRPRSNTRWISGAAALLAVAAIGGGIGFAIGKGSTPGTPSTGNAPVVAITTSAPAATANAAYIPLVSDFTITVDVLSKQCFGSAGCNLTYRVQPSYHGPALDLGQQYTVTYQINGTQDGAQVASFTMQGTSAQVQQQETAQTASSGTQLTAQVTNVLAN